MGPPCSRVSSTRSLQGRRPSAHGWAAPATTAANRAAIVALLLIWSYIGILKLRSSPTASATTAAYPEGIWGSDDWMEMWERGSQGRHGAEGEATSGALPWRHGDSRAEKPCGGGRCSGRASEQWHVLAGAGAGAQQQQQQQRQWSGAEEEEEEDDEQQQRQGQRQQGHVEVEEMRVQQVHTTSSSLVADESTLILRVKRMGSVTKPDQQLKGHTAMQAMLANLRTNDRGLRRRQH